MKKLEKLTLETLRQSPNVLSKEENKLIYGGQGEVPNFEDYDLFGNQAYYEKYGEILPYGTGYNPVDDVMYDITDPGVSEELYPGGITPIGGQDIDVRQFYEDYWNPTGMQGSDESANRVLTPLGEWLYYQIFE